MVARLVIAAPASGSGKTTVATGLMAALRARGRRVAPFKVGPDYIDPGYHSLAAGRPGRNLDPNLVGEHRVAPLFRHGAAGADIAVIEGVMGLFDGRIETGFGSTAHVAGLLDAPVLLVVDARGQSSSIAALLHGFRSFRPGVRLAGVVLNQVGSDRHEEVLRAACAEVGLPVLGAVRRAGAVAVPSRHLGLVPAAEHGADAVGAVAAMADLVASSVDLDAVVEMAATAPALPGDAWDAAAEVARGPAAVIAVAGGPAFTFGYAEHVELLAAAGAEVAVVDPVRDEKLPPDTAGLVLPGGFPEQHADALSANAPLRAAVADAVRAGLPVHAECGGLLYLASTLDGNPMCGALPVDAEMTPRLTLGYRDAVATVDSCLHPAGARVTGHEFHRTRTRPQHGDPPAWAWRDATGAAVREGFASASVHASYLHTHPAGHPEAVARFLAAARG
ncbi:cobyrinate a,c-diamide synthase [Actinokineospora sp. UTMC 2448]|uniref:cobyrinate a,c-diamide synthase n=1 Tax=Actinokineospora sp. UTMC 2448 TaxID=2268449 RepID=UPI0021649257|nr:cobyrinate a,c-diamide synthase [Actinokineospora sp. UTMC 2448]UVS78867.1 Cobyrinic acid A,C-diamide synthase [Actinokineospora sp. UTMC 2448]